MGIMVTAIGIALLLVTFVIAYLVFNSYLHFNMSQEASISSTLNLVLAAAIQAMFLGVMGWVGSIFLMRGVDFMKVDRGVGVVTFKVDKGVGVFTTTEETK